jgi:hypothetical protein
MIEITKGDTSQKPTITIPIAAVRYNTKGDINNVVIEKDTLQQLFEDFMVTPPVPNITISIEDEKKKTMEAIREARRQALLPDFKPLKLKTSKTKLLEGIDHIRFFF